MSNIAEGFAKETDKEFLRGLWISKGSAAEVQSLTYAALDLKYISENESSEIYNQVEKTCRLISGMIKYLNKNNSPTKRLNKPRTQGLKDRKDALL